MLMKLSIIIPVFNEEKTVIPLLKEVSEVKIADVSKEIIVVDDGSTDNSIPKVKSLLKKHHNSKINEIKLFAHTKNQGKGAAVKTGIKNATGDYVVIQDADLEYNPKFIPLLLKSINNKTK